LAAGVLLAAGAAGGYLAHLPQVNSGWIPVIAALGASLLTTVAVVGVEFLREHDADQELRRQQRRDAYSRFLVATAKFINITSEVHTIRQLVGKRAVTRIDDPVEFVHRFNSDIEPLMNAWSDVWLSGSGEAITAANRLVDATIPAMGMATAKGKALPWIVSAFLGERWSDHQERTFKDSLRKVGVLRKEFAEVARREIGEPTSDLFAGIEPSAESAEER
jgi:hypothetical protein